LLSEIGDDYTNTGDLISLSYQLRPELRLFLVSDQPDLAPLASESNLLVFRISKSLKQVIIDQGWHLTVVSEPGRLMRIQK